MAKTDLQNQTVSELRALAREIGVILPTRAKKDEIVAVLVAARGAQAGRAGRSAARTEQARTRKKEADVAVKSRKTPPSARSSKRPAPKKPPKKGTSAGSAEPATPTRKARADKARADDAAPAREARAGDAAPTRTARVDDAAPAGTARVDDAAPTRTARVDDAAPAGTARAATAHAPASRTAHAAATSAPAAGGVAVAEPRPAPARPAPAAAPEVAPAYGSDRLVLMARDPRWAFAYWELTLEKASDVLAHAGRDARLCLRVYEVQGGTAHATPLGSYQDFVVGERIGRRYLELNRPGRGFVAELGGLGADGTFVPGARSETAWLPRGSASEVIDRSFRPAGAIEMPGQPAAGTSPSAVSPFGGGPTSPGGGPSSPGGGPSSPGGGPSSPGGGPSSPGLGPR